MVSIGVTFDQDGKAIKAKPDNVLMGAVPTPVESAPAAAPAPRGGPMSPKPAAPSTTTTAPRWNPVTKQWE